MTPTQFEAWLLSIKHSRALRTDTSVAELLGVSSETLLLFRKNGLPKNGRNSDRRNWLACLALTEGLDLK